jgi:hypothetical protein
MARILLFEGDADRQNLHTSLPSPRKGAKSLQSNMSFEPDLHPASDNELQTMVFRSASGQHANLKNKSSLAQMAQT